MTNNNNKKCQGCGSFLSNTINTIGYTPKAVDIISLCQACYQLKHYKKSPNKDVEYESQLTQNVSNINLGADKSSRFLSVIVTDIYNLGMLDVIKTYPLAQNLLICINKIELIPYTYQQLLIKAWTEFAKSINKNFQILLLSTHTNFGMSKLLDIMKGFNEITFYGQTAVGKSSIINWVMKKHDLVPQLSIGSFLNTTKNVLANRFGRMKVIDTPGFDRKQGIFQFLNPNVIANLQEDQWKQFVFQINKPQCYFIENYAAIVISDPNVTKASLIGNMASKIKIHKTNVNNLEMFLEQKNLSLKKYDKPVVWKTIKYQINNKNFLQIDDLGWFQIKTDNVVEITLCLPNNVKVSIF